MTRMPAAVGIDGRDRGAAGEGTPVVGPKVEGGLEILEGQGIIQDLDIGQRLPLGPAGQRGKVAPIGWLGVEQRAPLAHHRAQRDGARRQRQAVEKLAALAGGSQRGRVERDQLLRWCFHSGLS